MLNIFLKKIFSSFLFSSYLFPICYHTTCQKSKNLIGEMDSIVWSIFLCFKGKNSKFYTLFNKHAKKKITSKMECTNQITPIQSLEPSPYLSWMGRYMDFNPLLDFLFFYQTFTFHMHIAYNFPPIFIQFLCIHYILCTSYFYSFY